MDDVESLEEKMKAIEEGKNVYETGTVVKVLDYMIEVRGLPNVSYMERVEVQNKGYGYVNKIMPNSVMVAMMKIDTAIYVGDIVTSTTQEYKAYYSKDAMGRITNLFGQDLLTDKYYEHMEAIPIERETIPLMDRTQVERPLQTGITGIDLIYPIGKGQRQLIIGDKKTGKTQICLDTIVNQKGKNMICIYCAIGKTKKEVKNIYYELLQKGAMQYSLIIAAFNDDLPPVMTQTPYFALSVAQSYMENGYDVFVCLDDLKRHAESYREISLISGKAPGRDAYPADIFYTHSRLLEKGCQYKNGASITILPVVETTSGDITDYISTNIISITDGQIVLSSKNFQKGLKPAIDYGLSVSRLGGQVQEQDMKVLGSLVRRKLLSYLETRDVYELANVDEMSEELKEKMKNGQKILDALTQYKYEPRNAEETIQKFSFLEGNNEQHT